MSEGVVMAFGPIIGNFEKGSKKHGLFFSLSVVRKYFVLSYPITLELSCPMLVFCESFLLISEKSSQDL